MPQALTTALAWIALGLCASAQSTWYVDVQATPPGDGSQGSPYASLQYAFAQGSTIDGDTVLVLPGTYVEDLNLQGKSLEVRSTAGSLQTTLQAATSTSVLRAAGVAQGSLEGFTLRAGRGTPLAGVRYGGGVVCSAATLELRDCALVENQADRGGAVAALNGSRLTIVGCDLSYNDAQQGGGIHADSSEVSTFQTVLSENRGDVMNTSISLPPRGGGVHLSGTATLEMVESDVIGCSPAMPFGGAALFNGGGLYLDGLEATLEDCVIENCGGVGTGPSYGGGVWVSTSTSFLRCTIQNNLCLNEGGGVYGSATFEDCGLINNLSTKGGGSVGQGSQFTDCLILDNRASALEGGCSGSGGGVYGGTLVGCRLEGNSCSRQGGGAFNATLTDCEVIGNRVSAGAACSSVQAGAGIASSTATGCLFEDNLVTASSAGVYSAVGGGASHESTLTQCTLRANRVEAIEANQSFGTYGGGAWGGSLVDCVLEDNEVLGGLGLSAQGGGMHGGTALRCTFRANRADSLDAGYELAVGGGAAATALTLCLLFDNEADHGGGAWKCDLSRCTLVANLAQVQGGALSVNPGGGSGTWGANSVEDSIAWANQPDQFEPGMGSIAATYSDVQGGYPGTGNIDADPDFWSLPARDLHLRAGSPCIDTGDPNAPLDADGSRRDMGALTFDPLYAGGPYVYCEAKLTSEGCLPAIGWSGTPSLTGPDDFVVSASEVVPSQNGILFWGLAPAAAPFMGGLRCVAHPLVRTPISGSGGAAACSGVVTFAFTQSYFASQGLLAGDRLFVQAWFRDPAQPDGTGVGLSDALDFTLWP